MSPLRHSVISIYAFNQTCIAFVIGCWLPRVTWRLCSEVEKQLFYPLQKAAWCQTTKAQSYQSTQAHFSSWHLEWLFKSPAEQSVFHTSPHLPLEDKKSSPLWLELHTFYSSVHQTLGTYTDDSLIIMMYEHLEASCWRWANSIKKYELQCEGGPQVYLRDVPCSTRRSPYLASWAQWMRHICFFMALHVHGDFWFQPCSSSEPLRISVI